MIRMRIIFGRQRRDMPPSWKFNSLPGVKLFKFDEVVSGTKGQITRILSLAGRMRSALMAGAGLLAITSSPSLAQSTPPSLPGTSDPQLKILLPAHLYATPGVEMNVYFDNICLGLDPVRHAVDVTCSKGLQQAERWIYLPAEQDGGEYPITVAVRDVFGRTLAQQESVLHVASKPAGSGKEISLLTIGDSLSQPLLYQMHLLELCKESDNPKIRLVGHSPNPEYPHLRTEGYGGWTPERFITYYKPGPREVGDWRVWNDSGSPFLYPDSSGMPKLDFDRFCKEFNDGKGPDIVTILLGANDMICASDEGFEEAIQKMLGYYDQLVEMVRKKNPDTKIGLMLLPPPASSQDAFGANFQCGLTRQQYKRRQFRLVEEMTKKYAHREKDSIFLLPTNTNLDCVHNYPSKKSPANARTKEEIARAENAVHPAYEGHLQMGDTLYSWIKNVLK